MGCSIAERAGKNTHIIGFFFKLPLGYPSKTPKFRQKPYILYIITVRDVPVTKISAIPGLARGLYSEKIGSPIPEYAIKNTHVICFFFQNTVWVPLKNPKISSKTVYPIHNFRKRRSREKNFAYPRLSQGPIE